MKDILDFGKKDFEFEVEFGVHCVSLATGTDHQWHFAFPKDVWSNAKSTLHGFRPTEP